MRSWIKVFHANGNQKINEVEILILNKIDFKTESVTAETATKLRRTLYNDKKCKSKKIHF